MYLVSGSDGNIYIEPYNGTITGSLYKTKYIQIIEDEFPEDTLSVPGILYDTGSNRDFPDVRHSQASLEDTTPCFDTGSLEGCVWVYGLNEASKSIIESDVEWIATYVTSSL